jgi:serine/threonine protein kinase
MSPAQTSLHDAAEPDDDIVAGMIIGDHFVITRKLGAGGMGEVYLAENLNLPGKHYAIKVLRKELSAIRRFAELLEGEAQRQSRLEHDNIVRIYDFFRWQQRYCLIMEFVDGKTLADLIDARPGGMPEAQALETMLDILKGLNHAHEQGVLHCDVKPPNVMISPDQRARVTDFGIARDVGGAAAAEHDAVIGTPEYMSPEQIEDPEHVDHRADVYSAGVVLFEMLTGRLPFSHDEGGARFPQLTREPADIRDYRRDLPPQLSRIVATALQRDRSTRFQGCMEFAQAIMAHRRQQRWRRTWLPAIAVTGVLAMAGAAAGYQWKVALEEKARQERAQNEIIAKQQRLENEARARKAIDASIATAIKQLGSLCRESVRLQTRQQALATATEAGFTGLAAKFRAQIDDMRRNMADYSHSYAEALAQMASFDAAVVAELVAAHPRDDPQAGEFLQAVRADHDSMATQHRMRTASQLLSSCPR